MRRKPCYVLLIGINSRTVEYLMLIIQRGFVSFCEILLVSLFLLNEYCCQLANSDWLVGDFHAPAGSVT